MDIEIWIEYVSHFTEYSSFDLFFNHFKIQKPFLAYRSHINRWQVGWSQFAEPWHKSSIHFTLMWENLFSNSCFRVPHHVLWRLIGPLVHSDLFLCSIHLLPFCWQLLIPKKHFAFQPLSQHLLLWNLTWNTHEIMLFSVFSFKEGQF